MLAISALVLLMSLLLFTVLGNSANAFLPLREYFYVGGEYANISIANQTGQYMINQIYVEKFSPVKETKPYPVVFIHGLGQTASNFLNTPDSRAGWASYFLSQDYVVYLPDQPSRGRSPWSPTIGTIGLSDTSMVERLFTAISDSDEWPQAKLHTQWPGSGKVGDPIFDAFFASQVQFQADERISEAQNKNAFTALLDKIGPAHLVTHSQAGSYGWQIADARPHLAKSIVALEPAGPPFISRIIGSGSTRPFGITQLDITYEPSVGSNATLLETVISPAIDAEHFECIMQAEPAKKLVNLVNTPVLVVTSEASYHAPYDYCTVEYLRQAGVNVQHMELGKEGIHGNGHMFFMEKNNLEIVERVLSWVGEVI